MTENQTPQNVPPRPSKQPTPKAGQVWQVLRPDEPPYAKFLITSVRDDGMRGFNVGDDVLGHISWSEWREWTDIAGAQLVEDLTEATE